MIFSFRNGIKLLQTVCKSSPMLEQMMLML